MRRRARVLGLVVAGALAVAGRTARAGQLVIDAPGSCLDPVILAGEVSDLIGKPLDSVTDVDFRVQLSETERHRWRLRLETIAASKDGPTVRASREIEGATCAELAEAASVAIAVSVRSLTAEGTPAPPPVSAPLRPPPSPEVLPARTTLARAPAPRPDPPWRPAVSLTLTVQAGTLPKPGPGIELQGVLQRGLLRLAVLGAWYASEDTVGSGDTGGSFQLALGGALACFAPRRGHLTAFSCAGFELGRLSGTGVGVARPETAAVFWRAARLEGGWTFAISPEVAVLLRGGLALPLARPQFVLDGAQLVYQPDRADARVSVGIELGL